MRTAALSVLLFLTGCASPPSNPDDICEIFREKGDWYDDAKDAQERWGSPIPVMMAIMHQESRFRHDARPPRKYLLGFIPFGRLSDAYGYAQAKDATWDWYRDKSGNGWAGRDAFDDAIDFIGWYNAMSVQQCRIDPADPYHLYLAYHEGHGGFNRRSFRSKSWLKRVAHKVSARSANYTRQLQGCQEELEKGWFFGLF